MERASYTYFISCMITGCAFKEEIMICKEPMLSRGHELLAILCLKNFDGGLLVCSLSLFNIIFLTLPRKTSHHIRTTYFTPFLITSLFARNDIIRSFVSKSLYRKNPAVAIRVRTLPKIFI